MPPRVVLTPRQIRSLLAMRANGARFEDIAVRFGISASVAHRIYKDHASRPKSKAHKK